jgi:hypothetical protein
MRPLSATECVTPAIERTKSLLFRPFQWTAFLKLAAVAFFAEIGGSFSLSGPGRHGHMPGVPPAAQAMIVAILLGIFLVAMVIGLVMLYVGSLLQLVTFHFVATRQTTIAPIWRRYSGPTWRWLGLKLLFLLALILVLLAALAPVILNMIKHMPSGGTPSSAVFFSHIVLFLSVTFLVVIVIGVAYILLRDLALPFLALEDLPITAALSRLHSLIAAEPGEIALYILFRFLLGLVAAIGAELLIGLTFIVSLIPFALIGGALWLVLHNAGTVGIAALIASAIVGGLVLLLWMACVTIGIVGTLFVFTQAYALYFLGGRYPILGNILEPAPFLHFTPPQPLPAQHGEDSPPLPTNPSPA